MTDEERQRGLHLKYFVLKPRGDDLYAAASRSALRTYANSIRSLNPELGSELLAWADDESRRTMEKYKD